jgi:hypothetical protein
MQSKHEDEEFERIERKEGGEGTEKPSKDFITFRVNSADVLD